MLAPVLLISMNCVTFRALAVRKCRTLRREDQSWHFLKQLRDQDKAIEVEGRGDGRAITLKQRREFLMAQAIDPPL